MSEIDKAYEKVNKEMTTSYELKREKLKKEEEDLKEELKTEVTKIKEQLELKSSEVDNLLNINKKIIKGIQSLDKEEKSMIKILSYISKINKIQKEMKSLFQELMKNLKISFIEGEGKESTIKYDEYYFNGIPIPKNIEFKEVGTNNFKVLWKIDNINLINVDKKEIKYRLEIRKENSKEEFTQIYEGNADNYLVNKLDKNTNYEIRICSIYKEIISHWSDIHKIKTKNLDCNILNETERGNEFLEKIYEWTGYKNMELLYRGTRDGSRSNIFHNKCDNQGPTLCLCKNEKGNIFGGYASISWTTTSGNYYSANGSFLFTLTNIHNTAPTKYPNTQNQGNAVYHNSGYGPTFGGGLDLYISDDCLNNNSSSSNLGYSYPDILGKGYSVFSGDINSRNFKLKEIEVFKLLN